VVVVVVMVVVSANDAQRAVCGTGAPTTTSTVCGGDGGALERQFEKGR